MSRNRLTRLASLAAWLALAATTTACASATTVHGIVVHHNNRAHSFVVAAPNGHLAAIHSSRAPRLARFVTVRARTLANGTLAAQHLSIHGHAHRARLHGVVSWSQRSTREFVVSAAGSSILVHTRDASQVPTAGQTVTSDVSINDQGDLEADDVNEQGRATGTMDLEGVVLSVDTADNTLGVSADDENQTGQAITVTLPASMTAASFQPGQEVELQVTRNTDGTYTATTATGDDNATEADDQGEDQPSGQDD